MFEMSSNLASFGWQVGGSGTCDVGTVQNVSNFCCVSLAYRYVGSSNLVSVFFFLFTVTFNRFQ